jgi:hypothetical protein
MHLLYDLEISALPFQAKHMQLKNNSIYLKLEFYFYYYDDFIGRGLIFYLGCFSSGYQTKCKKVKSYAKAFKGFGM